MIRESTNPNDFWFKGLRIISTYFTIHTRCKIQIDQLLLCQSYLIFYKIIFLSMTILSYFLFLLELIYDEWTHVYVSAQNSKNTFRSKCKVSLGAVFLLIQAQVAVLSMILCTEVPDNVDA